MGTAWGNWRGILISSMAITSLLAQDVNGQEAPAYDPAIEIQLLDLAPNSRSFMGVGDATLSKKYQYSLDFLLTFITDPFVIYNYDEQAEKIEDSRTDVISSIFAGQLVGAFGITQNLQMGLSLPLVFSMTGQGIEPTAGTMSAGGYQVSGLGDLRVELKGKLLRSANWAATWNAGLTLPTSYGSDGNDYLGDNLPAFKGGLASHWDSLGKRVRIGTNLGVWLRKEREIYTTEIGHQINYGAGISVKATKHFSLIAEFFGRTSLTAPGLDTSPLEVGGGLRAQVTPTLSILAGGGIGLNKSIGSPGLRFTFAIGYAPDSGDSDHDGVSNLYDQCPSSSEDMDGFEDGDGCPDLDNDGDRRPDTEDKCPNIKEDLDGFQDQDGCPEDDNDGDSILDINDLCPNHAEDKKAPYPKDGCPADRRDSDDDGVSDLVDQCPDDFEDADGFEDWDGCPEPDNDNDGIPDDDDQCPLCPEDNDSFQDGDGCPDLDNDHDGITDQRDQCPDKAEIFNGIKDSDGCPESEGQALATLKGNRLFLTKSITFRTRNKVRKEKTLLTIAKIMLATPLVRKWRIVVVASKASSDAKTKKKSQAQADEIRRVLIKGGLAPDSIEAIGAVSDTPTIAIAIIEKLEEQDFVCPATMQVKQREPTSTKKTQPPVSK